MSTKGLVLCVEDEPDIGLLLERTLDGLPVEVVVAENGVQALGRMAERRPDLIVLDLMLPQISGWEFLEQVKASEDWRDIPVVILSVRSGSADRKRGTALEVAHYMVKPFVPRELQRVVADLLNLGAS